MADGWLELESDPGLFTLLLEDFGVKGVQVEEVYDIQTNFEGPVYGFIFLFKWIEERRARRTKTLDEENYVKNERTINDMFFAKQIINNSCATHALVSVLLNCSGIELGDTLTKLKQFTNDMNPDDKGYAIGNMPDLERAHNSHSRPEPYRFPERQREGISVRTGEAFHFVSYVPINDHLIELDGLRPYPIDHGPWREGQEWTDRFREVIANRLGMSNSGGEPYHDIRFNLMAVVRDKRVIYNQRLANLTKNRQTILKTLAEASEAEKAKVLGHSDLKTSLKSDPLKTVTKKEDIPSVVPALSAAALKPGPSAAGQAPQQQQSLTPVRSSARLRQKGSAYSSAFAATNNSNSSSSCPNLPAAGGPDSAAAAAADVNQQLHAAAEEVYTKLAVKIDNQETESDVDIMADDDDVDSVANVTMQMRSSASSSHDLQPPLARDPAKAYEHMDTSDVKFHIKLFDSDQGIVTPRTVASTDVTKPLEIKTSYTHLPAGPGTGSSTDTASEVGSALSSPVCSTGLPSPTVLRSLAQQQEQRAAAAAAAVAGNAASLKTEVGQMSKLSLTPNRDVSPAAAGTSSVEMAAPARPCDMMTSGSESGSPEQRKLKRKKPPKPRGFSQRDLVQLLQNVESEIKKCEDCLSEETQKFHKYKVDDQRRTHNYDDFIITFLTMLAEQGKLQDIVQEKRTSNALARRKPRAVANATSASGGKGKKRK